MFDLAEYEIDVDKVFRNASPATLYQEALRYEKGATLSDTGALIAYSGDKTGRSPKDKRIVEHPDSSDDVWWGPVNIGLDESIFCVNRERATDYLNTRSRLYVVDAFAGWDPDYRLKVRVICARPYHALFMHNMLIRPTREELANFGEPDCLILNAGAFPANRYTAGMTSKTSVDLSLERRRSRHSGDAVRRRNEESGVHADELFDAAAGRAADALLGHRRIRKWTDRRCCSDSPVPAKRRCQPIPNEN